MTTGDTTDSGARVLLVTAVPLGRNEVTRVLAEEDLEASSVRVLAPSLNDSSLAFWVSDADEAIAEAQEAASVTTRAVDEVTPDATEVSSEVGDSDPLLAIGDALRIFPADRIVTIRRSGPRASHKEDELNPQALRRAFGLPVTAHVLAG